MRQASVIEGDCSRSAAPRARPMRMNPTTIATRDAARPALQMVGSSGAWPITVWGGGEHQDGGVRPDDEVQDPSPCRLREGAVAEQDGGHDEGLDPVEGDRVRELGHTPLAVPDGLRHGHPRFHEVVAELDDPLADAEPARDQHQAADDRDADQPITRGLDQGPDEHGDEAQGHDAHHDPHRGENRRVAGLEGVEVRRPAAPRLQRDETDLDGRRHQQGPGDGAGETRAVGKPVEHPSDGCQQQRDRHREHQRLAERHRSRPRPTVGGEDSDMEQPDDEPGDGSGGQDASGTADRTQVGNQVPDQGWGHVGLL
jgi:hypothetical protein